MNFLKRDLKSGILNTLSKAIRSTIYNQVQPNYRKLEEVCLNIFKQYRLDSDLINYEEFVTSGIKNSQPIKVFIDSLPMSSKGFIQKFKKYYSITPNEFYLLKKINYSIALIESGKHLKLTTVGLESGFYDQSHFIRTFRKYCGCSPKQFQKERIGKFYTIPA